jgi:phosphinothricin acetyltransferase
MITIRQFQPADWPAVQNIYQQGIETNQATFQPKAKTWAEWDESNLPQCRLVATTADETVVGWATLSAVSKRAVYQGVAEVSIYIAADQRGQGVGKLLLTALVEASEQAGFWTLQAVIFPENQASVAMAERCGFRLVGRREKIGRQHGLWRDTVLLERRSRVVGV